MLLSELKKGEVAKVVKVHESEFREKLLEMGCIPGANIRFLMKAPFGDPIAYILDGYCLSMRKNEAIKVEVERIEE